MLEELLLHFKSWQAPQKQQLTKKSLPDPKVGALALEQTIMTRAKPSLLPCQGCWWRGLDLEVPAASPDPPHSSLSRAPPTKSYPRAPQDTPKTWGAAPTWHLAPGQRVPHLKRLPWT